MPELVVDADGAGLRLDRFLQKALPGMPRSHVFKLLRTRKVRVNGKRARPEQRLASGDRVLVHADAARFEQDRCRPLGRATRMDFSVVYEDGQLLVVSKPPFQPVHPGAGHAADSLIDQVHAYLEVPDRPAAFRPSLAHRLDRDTSGLVMVGKDAATLRALGRMLKAGEVSKRYLALARGVPRAREGRWDLEVQRRDIPGAKKSGRGRADAPGSTLYRVAAERSLRLAGCRPLRISLLTLELLTGRTHQIRSHLLQAGHPLLGDRRYGDRELNRKLRAAFGLERQFLHAYRLELAHPATGKPLALASPYPDDLRPLVEALRLGVPA
ncbi:MAG: RluA family pseudouridine synthase [Deltaproteobacteria bacterium]|nr:RluA family pseudouridine synthase [Deltaproteobacteria bacterium]